MHSERDEVTDDKENERGWEDDSRTVIDFVPLAGRFTPVDVPVDMEQQLLDHVTRVDMVMIIGAIHIVTVSSVEQLFSQ